MILADIWAAKSKLGCVNPSVKCLYAAVTMVLCLITNAFQVWLAVILSVVLLLWLKGKTPLSVVFRQMAVPAVFLFLSCGMSVFTWTEGKGLAGIIVTRETLEYGSGLFLKAYSVVSCMIFISLTTTVPEVIDVLRKMKVSPLVIELMFLIYRYLFVLLERFSQMHTAAQSRLGYGGFRSSWYAFTHLCGNLLASSFHQSSLCFDAMESRGYQGKLEFLTEKKQYKLSHGLIGIMYLSCLAVMAWAFR